MVARSSAMVGAASLAVVLAIALSGCRLAVPLNCADGITPEDCRHAYNLADLQLADDEVPTAVWVGSGCLPEPCPPGSGDGGRFVVIFSTHRGQIAFVMTRRDGRATRYDGPLPSPYAQ